MSFAHIGTNPQRIIFITAAAFFPHDNAHVLRRRDVPRNAQIWDSAIRQAIERM
jgi:hypothetical protein